MHGQVNCSGRRANYNMVFGRARSVDGGLKKSPKRLLLSGKSCHHLWHFDIEITQGPTPNPVIILWLYRDAQVIGAVNDRFSC